MALKMLTKTKARLMKQNVNPETKAMETKIYVAHSTKTPCHADIKLGNILNAENSRITSTNALVPHAHAAPVTPKCLVRKNKVGT